MGPEERGPLPAEKPGQVDGRLEAAEALLRRLVESYYGGGDTGQFTEDAVDIAVSARELLEGERG
jgi:hypothetical protein